MKFIKFFVLLIVILSLAACTSSRYRYSSDRMPSDYQSYDVSKIPNAVPKVEPKSRQGNPSSYIVLGKR